MRRQLASPTVAAGRTKRNATNQFMRRIAAPRASRLASDARVDGAHEHIRRMQNPNTSETSSGHCLFNRNLNFVLKYSASASQLPWRTSEYLTSTNSVVAIKNAPALRTPRGLHGLRPPRYVVMVSKDQDNALPIARSPDSHPRYPDYC